MALQDRINAAVRVWGRILVSDMRKSINTALKKGTVTKNGNRVSKSNPGESSLSGSVRMDIVDGVFYLYMADYWQYVDKGRGATKNKTGSGIVRKRMGADWMGSAGINPSKLLAEITENYYKKKGIKRKVKPLKFDKAVKSLSFILSRAVHKNGYNPRPFYDEVWNEERKQQLVDIIGKEFVNEIKLTFE